MKNKLLKTLFLFIMIFSLSVCSDVRAEITDSAAGTDGGAAYQQCTTCSVTYDTSLQGMRVTLVDASGNRIKGTKSIDFVIQGNGQFVGYTATPGSEITLYNSILNDNFFMNGNSNNSKKEVSVNSVKWVKKKYTLYNAPTSGSKSSPRYNLTKYIGANNSGKSKDYFKNYFESFTSDELKSNFLNKMVGENFDNWLKKQNRDVCNSITTSYFIIEPMIKVDEGGKNSFFGTTTEFVTYSIKSFENKWGSSLLSGDWHNNEVIQRPKSETSSDGYAYMFLYNLSVAMYVPTGDSLAGFTGIDYNVQNNKSCKVGDKGYTGCFAPTGKYYVEKNNIGYGVSVFKLTGNLETDPCKECYTINQTCEYTECENTDKNNSRVCWSFAEQIGCEKVEEEDAYNSAGEKTFTIIENECSLYCTEEATVSYPGNIGDAISIYTPFAWPTNKGKYPLTTTATLTCKPMMHDGSEANSVCLSKLAKMDKSQFKYENSTNSAQVKYEHYQYEEIKTTTLEQQCTPSSLTTESGNIYKITSNCSYTLPTKYTVVIDKENGKLENIEYHEAIFSDIQIKKLLITDGPVFLESGLIWNDKNALFTSAYDIVNGLTFGKNYKLIVENIPLGHAGKTHAGQFTELLNNETYECDYRITTVPEGSCACPPDSKYNGLELTPQLADKIITCLDAQNLFCNESPFCVKADGTKVTTEYAACIEKDKNTVDYCTNKYCPKYCPPGTTYAGETYEDKNKYKVCKASGGTDEKCIELACNCGTNCYHYCPPGTPKAGNDITDCVVSEQAKGNKLAVAQKTCQKVYCYDSLGNGNIIYRTISLENPFPSKDADLKVNQSGLSKGMFNTTIKGRYPGTNWNSVTIVREKILNNRGYNGSEIYEKAKPLYVIELDPTAIKKIRDYNKKQEDNGGYSDFTLNCTNGAYCISSFIRSGITTADGTNMLTGGTCATANNKKTFTNCYTYK